jgi:hypothetical protein
VLVARVKKKGLFLTYIEEEKLKQARFKKERVVPYIYRGGEVKAGAVSVAPWAMGVSTPAEIGVTSALGIAKKGGFRGTGMTQDAYKSQTAHRTYSSPTTAKKTSTDASKAVAHAKRLRAGRGD